MAGFSLFRRSTAMPMIGKLSNWFAMTDFPEPWWHQISTFSGGISRFNARNGANKKSRFAAAFLSNP
jgi:hypothetical protein